MRKSTVFEYAENIKIKLASCLKSATMRDKKTPNAFTRAGGKLGAFNTIFLILRGMKSSLQSTLDEFFRELCGGEIMASRQAISVARQQVNPLYVREYFDEGVEIIAKDDTLKTFKGKRAISVDGMDIALENETALIAEFGCSGKNKDACTALSSFALDIFTGVAYDCQIAPYVASERDLLNKHIVRLTELGFQGSILIGDRGYPSYDEFMHIINSGFDFLIRLPKSYTNVISQIENGDTLFEITNENNDKYYFRAIAVTLSTGEVEYLATSLGSDFLTPDEAKGLYGLRWGSETKYDHIKNTLELENFSGKTVNSVLQDFYATAVPANMVSCFAAVADDEIAKNDRLKPGLKYARKANRNTVARNVVLSFLVLMIEPNPIRQQREMDLIFSQITKSPVAIVPGRNPPRKQPRKKKFNNAKRK